jgi:hypothetical protein
MKQKFKIEDIEKKENFLVPDGYFEILPYQIQKKIQKEKTSTWFAQPSFKIAFAASVGLVLFFLGYLNFKTGQTIDYFAEIEGSEIRDYISENYQSQEIIELANHPEIELKNVDLSGINVTEEVLLENLSTDEINELSEEL